MWCYCFSCNPLCWRIWIKHGSNITLLVTMLGGLFLPLLLLPECSLCKLSDAIPWMDSVSTLSWCQQKSSSSTDNIFSINKRVKTEYLPRWHGIIYQASIHLHPALRGVLSGRIMTSLQQNLRPGNPKKQGTPPDNWCPMWESMAPYFQLQSSNNWWRRVANEPKASHGLARFVFEKVVRSEEQNCSFLASNF